MIALSPKESAALGNALQFKSFPLKERLGWLSDGSKEAQDLAKYMLGVMPETEATDEIREAAKLVQKWLDNNRKIGEYRQTQRAMRQAVSESTRTLAKR